MNDCPLNIRFQDKLRTKVFLPASKSISNRALVINALTSEGILPNNLSKCDDTDVMVSALQQMPYEINIKAAGTAMRFMTAYLSVKDGEHIITGSERMKHRPIQVLVNCLRDLGAQIEYVGEEGYPPLKINGGHMRGGEVSICGNVSSQFISALMLVAPALPEGLQLKLEGEVISRPYIEMTLSMMRTFGAKAEMSDENVITVHPQRYSPKNYTIESDWSAASYWYEMVALSSDHDAEVTLPYLYRDSIQGDHVVADIFQRMDVNTEFLPDAIKISKRSAQISSNSIFEYDFSACPDLAQTIVCTCCGMGVTFRFTGLKTLRIKETDRIAALQNELKKLGFVIHVKGDDEMSWLGEKSSPTDEAIDTYDDHRMAMAFAPLAYVFGSIKINNPEVVSKSYPDYWKDLCLSQN